MARMSMYQYHAEILLLQRRAAVLFFVLLTLAGLVCAETNSTDVRLMLPGHRLEPGELAIIVNDADPLSVRIGEYYQKARGIPIENLLHVRFRPGRSKLPAKIFSGIRKQLERVTPDHIQAWAITWTAPYRVDCMSITSALTFGFDQAWCSSKRCAPTAVNPWFRQSTSKPYTDFGIRPTMAIAATDFEQARVLIDRGIASDGSQPGGTAYLVSTSDRARNVRASRFPAIEKHFEGWLETRIVKADSLKDKDDVLFYITGKAWIAHLNTLQFVPGAAADHLTSAGGKLTDSRQMSSLRWLEAGATGSYGTVVEPCNLPGKFPDPAILIESYTHGKTLLEAYWQSVQQPGEGIFIGEPLAAPFDGYSLDVEDDAILLHTRVLLPGTYRIYSSPGPIGPYQPTAELIESGVHQEIYRLPRNGNPFLKLVPVTPVNAAAEHRKILPKND